MAAMETRFEVRAAGCTNLSIQIGRDNAAARAFYRGHGFADRAGFELADKPLVQNSSWSLRPWVLLVPCLVDGAIRSTRTKSAAMAPGAQTCGWDS